MRGLVGILSVCVVSVAVTSNVARAIEPDAPLRLITPEEAIAITIRQRLSDLPGKENDLAKKERSQLAKFYAREKAKPVWVTKDGLTDRARQALAELRKADQWGLQPTDFSIPTEDELARTNLSVRELVATELKISLAIAKYARYASGGKYDPKDLSNDIDRTPELPNAGDVIAKVSTASDPAAALLLYHPQQEQFKRLRLAYLKALDGERAPGAGNGNNKSGKSHRKHRRSDDKHDAERLLYNMDMWRWMPRKLGKVHVTANIPEFKFRFVDNGHVLHEERIITGKVKHKTPIFSDEMETVVINPNWNVPNSIKIKELLPGLLRGKNVIGRQGLRVEDYRGRELDPYSIDWYSEDIRNFRIYQPPSERNALGVVKFLFPNSHSVYMHDTPSKYLFKKRVRAYSHGCVRVRNPLKFAALLLGRDKGWSMDYIKQLVRRGENNPVPLDTKIPVHVAYFTAHVDENGETSFYDDVYKYEKLVKMGMAGKAHLIVKPKKDLNKDLQRITGLRRKRKQQTSFWFSPYQDNDSGSSYSSGNLGQTPKWARRVWGLD